MTTLKNPVAFSANRLLDGEAVWLGAHGRWVEDIAHARVIKTIEQLDMASNEALKADADNVVVEPYQIDVELDGGSITPVKFRERIRAAGPTIRLDLGKQAHIAAHAA